ncbi:MAG: HAD-IIIC family phosphatase, partial [Alphaproteobacteria bacterium]|nr:HAD-IIIC family phosphatase [Alphaproteobacteria bacterium]
MNNPDPIQHRGREDFRAWLRDELGKSSDVGYTRVDFSMSLAEIGLSSIHLVRLTGELEELLGLELEPSILQEFATIEDMCVTLLRMAEGRKARAAERGPGCPVALAASFTAEPIEPALAHLLGALGLEPRVTFAAYNQVFQELLNSSSALSRNTDGVNVVLLRIEDWFRYADAPPTPAEVARTVDDLLNALEGFAARSKTPLLLGLAPHSPHTVRRLGLGDQLTALDDRILAAAEALDGVHPLDLRRVDEPYRVPRLWDEERDRLGHIPFTQAAYAAMGAATARRIAALRVPAAKVIALDCDNTLWGGVAGDVGPDGVDVTGPFRALQAFMVDQAERGAVLCLVSKNDEAAVWAVFDAHPEMPLRRAHIAAHRVNWQPKSQNLLELAEELSLGLDSFIFVDDNPMEVTEVSEALPAVLAVRLPPPPRIEGFLEHHWAFDRQATTAEDRRRAQLYADNRARKEVREAAASFEDFLARLALVVDLAPLDDDEVERASQLTKRTNQFNANKVERSTGDIQALRAAPERVTRRVRVSDRFGDYGLVGLLSAEVQSARLVCDTFLLSCRVLGRRVEHRMIQALAALARERGCAEVEVRFSRKERNAPIARFLDSVGGGLRLDAEGQGALRFAPDEVDALLTDAVDEARPAPSSASAASPTPRALAAAGFDHIAALGGNIEALRATIATSSMAHRPDLATPYVTPRTAWEKKIAAIWRNVLGMDRVGANDSWFELGGDSLGAAEALA